MAGARCTCRNICKGTGRARQLSRACCRPHTRLITLNAPARTVPSPAANSRLSCQRGVNPKARSCAPVAGLPPSHHCLDRLHFGLDFFLEIFWAARGGWDRRFRPRFWVHRIGNPVAPLAHELVPTRQQSSLSRLTHRPCDPFHPPKTGGVRSWSRRYLRIRPDLTVLA